MSRLAATAAILGAIVGTFVVVESWHLISALVAAQARLQEVNGPRVWEITKSQIAEFHKKEYHVLDKEGNALHMKKEPKTPAKLAQGN